MRKNKRGFTPHLLRGNRRANFRHTRKGAGFTLIELLVVIAIVSITASIMVVNFRKGGETGNLQRTAQQIIQNIRKAQNMALSSVKHGGEIYDYYGAHFNQPSMPDSYYIFVSDNAVYNGGEEIGGAIELEKGIKIDSISTGNRLDITFNPPYAFVEFNPADTEATITIKKEGGACPQDCRYIIINDKGWMSIKTSL